MKLHEKFIGKAQVSLLVAMILADSAKIALKVVKIKCSKTRLSFKEKAKLFEERFEEALDNYNSALTHISEHEKIRAQWR